MIDRERKEARSFVELVTDTSFQGRLRWTPTDISGIYVASVPPLRFLLSVEDGLTIHEDTLQVSGSKEEWVTRTIYVRPDDVPLDLLIGEVEAEIALDMPSVVDITTGSSAEKAGQELWQRLERLSKRLSGNILGPSDEQEEAFRNISDALIKSAKENGKLIVESGCFSS